MTLDEAIQEFEFDCKIRHLSLKTIDNYRKQLRYFERFLADELSITPEGERQSSGSLISTGLEGVYPRMDICRCERMGSSM